MQQAAVPILRNNGVGDNFPGKLISGLGDVNTIIPTAKSRMRTGRRVIQ
jgi:hypothetical protein